MPASQSSGYGSAKSPRLSICGMRNELRSLTRHVNLSIGNRMMPSHSALKLLDLIQSHRVTAVVYVAAKLGIGELLRDGPRSLDEFAKATAADQQTLGRLLNPLLTVGL